MLLIQLILILLLVVNHSLAKFDVYIDKFDILKSNPKFIDVTAKAVRFNNTWDHNVVDMTFTILDSSKIDEKNLATVDAFVGMGKSYRKIQGVQVRANWKQFITSTKAMDIPRLLHQNCNPPFVWPIKANTKYHMSNWTPDPASFPALVPGKFKIELNFYLPKNELAWAIVVNARVVSK